MPEVASTGVGAPEVQMLFRSPTTPEPAWQRPRMPPMSPTPGTLQMPASGAAGVTSEVSWAGAVLATGAADAERAMNRALSTIAAITLASSSARAGRLFPDRPARGWGSAISEGSCIRRSYLGVVAAGWGRRARV